MMDNAAVTIDTRPIPPAPRYYAGFNWLGFQTLYLREVKRFWKVWLQTVVSPIVTTLLYMLVFVVAIGQARPTVMGVSFAEFVAPGLIMMSILSNAFANSSSSLLQAKMMGLTPDFLTPPLSSVEQAAAFSAGAVTRGLLVGLVTAISVWPFAHFHIAHLWAVVYFGVGAALMMATAGVFVGLWSEKFDHLAAVSNFVILPMTFLSGTFFVIDNLPGPARALSAVNPFFYVIDGFRYGFIGGADGHLLTGVIAIAVLNVILAVGCWSLFHTGYRLRT